MKPDDEGKSMKTVSVNDLRPVGVKTMTTSRYIVNRHYSVPGIWQGLWNVIDNAAAGMIVETHSDKLAAEKRAAELETYSFR